MLAVLAAGDTSRNTHCHRRRRRLLVDTRGSSVVPELTLPLLQLSATRIAGLCTPVSQPTPLPFRPAPLTGVAMRKDREAGLSLARRLRQQRLHREAPWWRQRDVDQGDRQIPSTDARQTDRDSVGQAWHGAEYGTKSGSQDASEKRQGGGGRREGETGLIVLVCLEAQTGGVAASRQLPAAAGPPPLLLRDRRRRHHHRSKAVPPTLL